MLGFQVRDEFEYKFLFSNSCGAGNCYFYIKEKLFNLPNFYELLCTIELPGRVERAQ